MNAAELVALADAHGIDFIHVAGSANRHDGVAGKRRRVLIEIEDGITEESRKKHRTEAADTAQGKGSRTAKPKAWGQQELGIAATGVEALHWAAIQHTIASDRRPQTIRTLMCGLRYYANKLATQSNWEAQLPARFERDPKTGRRIVKRDPTTKAKIIDPRSSVFYLDPLCMLVLDEISFRPAFSKAPGLYAIYLGIEEHTWEKILLERFELLQQRYAAWYGAGLGMIQRRINGEEERAA